MQLNLFHPIKRILNYLLVASLGGLLTCLPGCSRQDEPIPTANPTSVAATSPARAKAQAWFAGLSSKSTAASRKSSTASRTAGDAQPAIDWERALYSEEYLVAPFTDTDNPFVASQQYGYRFLVVRTAGDSCTGRIVELITKEATAPEKAADLALAGARPFLTGQAPGPVADFTSALLVYSPEYAYETGLAYAAGAVQPLRMQGHSAGPDLPASNGCYDYFLNGYDNTGALVVHNYLFSNGNCTGGVPGSDSGWGGGGGAPTGGGSVGGGSSSASVFIPTGGPKVNPQQEVKCFTTSQPATVTVYVSQPVPGTNALNGGTVGVGHTFIGIEQNGITRYMGYYPPPSATRLGVAMGRNYVGEVDDDSGHAYNISISTSVSGTQLSSIITYLSNSVPATYNLNTYSCADFGIVIGNLAGLNLPATTTTSGFGPLIIFNGRSPGQLGQDIRNMNPQSGVTVDTTGGNAPTKQGGC